MIALFKLPGLQTLNLCRRIVVYFFSITILVALVISCHSKGQQRNPRSLGDPSKENTHSSVTGELLKSDTNVYPFGIILVEEGSASKEVSLFNESNQSLYIQEFRLTQSSEEFFIVDNNCPLTPIPLSPAASCTFKVTFAPLTDGDKATTIEVLYGNSASDFPLIQRISFSGTGSSTIAATAIKFTPSQVTFSSVAVGNHSEEQNVLLTNAYKQDLFISKISGDHVNYSVNNVDCPIDSAFSPDTSCTVKVIFAPLTAGVSTMSLSVKYGLQKGQNNLETTMNLNGTGISALDFNGISTVTNITTTTATLNWVKPNGALGYHVFSIDSSGTKSLVTTLTADKTSYDLNGLIPQTEYKYQVNAIDQFGIIDSNNNTKTFTTDALGSCI